MRTLRFLLTVTVPIVLGLLYAASQIQRFRGVESARGHAMVVDSPPMIYGSLGLAVLAVIMCFAKDSMDEGNSP